MGDPIDVSVIVAAWNASAGLERSVTSALAQDGVSVEVVVSDDASEDDTAAVAARLASQDPRVVVVGSTVNRGPSAARNRAIAVARGRWVAVLDADDAFAAGRLARLTAFGEVHAADVVLDNLQEVDEWGRPVAPGPFLAMEAPERWDLRRWALDNRVLATRCTGFLKPLIRRGFLEAHGLAYNETLRNSEDFALIAEALAAGAALWVEPAPGYLYTRAAGSASHRYRVGELDALIAFASRFAAGVEQVADGETRAAISAHLDALENARTLTHVVEGLKERRFLAAVAPVLARPGSLALVLRWIGEAVGKRIRPGFPGRA